MLTGTAVPSEGTGMIGGHDVVKDSIRAKRLVGVAHQHPDFDHHLNLKENLYFHLRLYGYSRRDAKDRVKQGMKWARLEDHWKKKADQLSGGMKKRLQVSKALITDPDVLFLDEPTTGLDPQSRRHLWESIRDLKNQGKTIVLTTHYMEEADILCDRVAIIDRGRIIVEGTSSKLKGLLQDKITLEIVPKEFKGSESLSSALKGFEDVLYAGFNGKKLLIHLKDEKGIEKVVREVMARNGILSLESIRPSLEDVFIHLTGRELRE